MNIQDPMSKNARRWAELMRLCGLRGHVFSDVEQTTAEAGPPEEDDVAEEPGR